MRRLPAFAFAALVAGTIAAFFITQHLKVSDPLIASVRLVPRSFNPAHGRVCLIGAESRPRSFKRTTISFFLPDHSDTTGVFVLNESGTVVRSLGWRQLQKGKRAKFIWDGRESNGSYAPPGNYYLKVVLQKEGRAFELAGKYLRIVTKSPQPKVTRVVLVSPHSAAGSQKPSASQPTAADVAAPGKTVLTPGQGVVKIDFRPRTYRSAKVIVYRTSADGTLQPVAHFRAPAQNGTARWNGMIDGHPAPAGVYMIGVQVTDQACNIGSFPALPPAPGSTAGTGVTISYLSVVPELSPVPAGGEASLYVDAHGASYTWALRSPGATHPLSHGTVAAGASGPLNFRIPSVDPGLYVVTVKRGAHEVTVPMVVSSSRRRQVLVVLPALTWQGSNPVDDNGNGLPNMLTRQGETVALNRPLVNGLPEGFQQERALLRYLQKEHLRYQLTTDVALAEGSGPALAGHRGVILDGEFRWVPAGVASALRRYVKRGGKVLSLGVSSLLASAPITPGNPRAGTGPSAGPASQLAADPFGARHGTVQPLGKELVTTFADPLKIFGQGTAFNGFRQYQPITPPTGTNVSVAGVAAQAPAIAGFKLGQGTVVEVGLSGFGDNLRHDDASRQLLARVWKLFTG